jgi:Na+/H+ antiporter NhaD/arsenite permease-like protein
MQSRMPAVMAEWLVDRTRTARGAMLAVCALSGALSALVENVAVVLLLAPVALSLAKKLNISPVRLIISVAICSNLQGTATLIGDPPSMILAGYLKMTFNDFFFYQGKPGIFFAVQAGALVSLMVLFFLFRRHGEKIELVAVEKVRSWIPSLLLLALIIGLSATWILDPDFIWLAGVMTIALAGIGLIWYQWMPHWGTTRDLVKTLDWDTTFFLIGVFIVVGAVSESGWLEKVASWISLQVGSNLLYAFILIVAVAVIISGFVDNVPFLLAMIPVAQKVADDLGAPGPVLVFGLLIGACLGGNITPIGASANVVAIGLLRKQGHLVSFREFMKLGIPFTVAAVIASCLFVWWIFG